MGIPWDEDEIGTDCPQFPAGTTPKYLWCSISGVERCNPEGLNPGMPNGVYMLTQHSSFPCRWVTSEPLGNTGIQYEAKTISCTLSAYNSGFVTFAGLTLGALKFSFTNGDSCSTYPPLPLAGGGSAIVARTKPGSAPAVANVAELLNIEEEPDSMADFYPAADDKVVLKFCRQKTPTNILIVVDYSSFES